MEEILKEKISELKELVLKLNRIRNIPQLLLIDIIYPGSVIPLRKVILDYKKTHPDIDEI